MNSSYDVIIIGKGISGLSAALSSASNGAKVMIISDCNVGSTVLAQKGVFRFALNKKDIRCKIIEHGKKLAKPEIVDIFVNLLQDSQKKIENIFDLKKAEHVGMCVKGGGTQIISILESIAISKGVKITNAKVIKILTSDNTVSAVQILYNMRLFTIHTKTVIIACGGIGSIYSKTDNSQNITIPGCSLALDAGASLRDMEFQVFHPFCSLNQYTIFGTRPIYTFFDIQKTKIFSKKGQRLYSIEELVNSGDAHSCINFISKCISRHDFIYFFKNNEKIVLQPVYHSLIGGIDTNSNLMTKTEGLFAAGESMGGLHGAERLGGMAITEGFVMGSKAGTEASIYSNKKSFNYIDKKTMIPESLKCGMISKKTIDSIRFLSNQFLFVERNEKNLILCRNHLNLIMKKINLSSISGYIEKGMIQSAIAVVNSSLIRKECRGAYYREDYLNQDSYFDNSTITSYKNDAFSYEKDLR